MARNRTPRFMNLFSPERRSARTSRWQQRFRKFSLSSWQSSRIVESVCSVFRAGANAARVVRGATGSQLVGAGSSRSLRMEGLEERQLLAANPYASLTGATYTQDFNTLAATGLSATVPQGWLFTESGTSLQVDGQYTSGDGASNAANTYSFGTTGTSDRAFGALRSGTLLSTIGAAFQNNTSGGIETLTISYTGEQWRLGAISSDHADKVDFQYSLDATSLTSGTWTDVNALDFNAPITGTSGVPLGARNGNDLANRSTVSGTISSLNIPVGSTIFIRWNDFDATGADDGLGVDDFSVTSTAVNTPPTANSQTISTDEDIAKPGILTATDAPGTSFTFAVQQPQHGTVILDGNRFTYTPAGDYNGPDSFTFTASDGSLTSAPATVSITVLPVNDPPVANVGEPSTQEDVAITRTLSAFDADLDALTFAIASGPSHGTISGFNPATGAYTYTPDANYNGPDSFTFTASDATSTSAPGQVLINISPVNDPPTFALPSAISVPENVAVVLDNLRSYGSDVDGPNPITGFTVSGVDAASRGGWFEAGNALRVTNPLDYETPDDADGDRVYHIIVTATFMDGSSADRAIAVTVTDAFEVPVPVSATLVGGDLTVTVLDGQDHNLGLVFGAGPGGGPNVKVFDGATQLGEFDLSLVTGTIDVTGGAGADTLRAIATFSDMSSADVTDISFDGGGGFDTLDLSINFAKIEYKYDDPSSGKVSYSDLSITKRGSISYTNIEPITNTGTVANAEFILTAGADDATLTSLGGGMYRLSGATFEDTDFMLPTGSLTIRGDGAADVLTVSSAVSVPSITLDFETIKLGANLTGTLAGGATTSVVDVLNSSAQIRDAIVLVANNGDVIVRAGTYNETLSIAPGKNLDLLGVGAGSVTLNGGPTSTPLTVTGGSNVDVDGFTITGGIFGINALNNADLTITNSVISAGSAVGVQVLNGSTLTVADSTLTGPNPVGLGAGVAVIDGSADIRRSIIKDRTDGVVIDADGSATLFNNDLSDTFGNYAIQANAAAGVIDASGNWWGTINENAVAAKVLGTVDFTPYLAGGTASATGFNGNFSQLYVVSDTLSEQAGSSGRIQEAIGLINSLGTVTVNDGVYDETVLVNKDILLESDTLYGAQIKPTTGSQQTVVRIDATGVTVDGFAIQVNQNDDASIGGTAPIAPVGVGAVGTLMDGLLLSNNQITSIGNGTVNWNGGPPLGITVRAAGIVLNDTPSGNIPSVTLTDNDVSILSGTSFFQRAVWLAQLNATITGNTFAGAANDLQFQFASGGSSLIDDNDFEGQHRAGGAGVVISGPNTSSPITISNNRFTPVAGDPFNIQTALHVNQSQNGGNGSPVIVVGNTFSGHVLGITSENSNGLTIDGNTFTPAAGLPNQPLLGADFVHISINSASSSSGANPLLAIEADIKNNVFNTAAASEGVAVSVVDGLSGTFGDVEIGVGGANTYNGAHTTGVRVTGGIATVTDNIAGAGTGLSVSGGTAILAGSTLAGNTTGVSVTGPGVLTVGSGNAISGATTGILLSGPAAGLTGLSFGNISIAATGDYITLVNTAFDNLDLDATGTTLGGIAVALMTPAQLFAASNKITDEQDDNTLGRVVLVANTLFVSPAIAPTAADNDYTRIANALDAAANGDTILLGLNTALDGVFNWDEPFALASWELGNDGILNTDDDWGAMLPAGINDVTVTAVATDQITIQGPGDLTSTSFETAFLAFGNGTNTGWEFSNFNIYDIDTAIGLYYDGADDYSGLVVNNLDIEVPADNTVEPNDFQNLGIYYSAGQNISITNNRIVIDGAGTGDTVGIQSSTHGSVFYDGLQITGNVITVTALSAGYGVTGIWENGHAHLSDITVSGNSFTGFGDPTTTDQSAFVITSHSSATTTVAYTGNTIDNAAIGFEWLDEFGMIPQVYTGTEAVEVTGNTLTDVNIGISVGGVDASALISGNTLTNSGAMLGVGTGVLVQASSSATIDASVAAGQISGFATGVEIAGTATIDGATITGNATGRGIAVIGGVAKIQNANLTGNQVGIYVEDDAVVDAGSLVSEGDPIDPTGLGASAGNNLLTGYTGVLGNYAIENQNLDVAGNVDVYARNNSFGSVIPAVIEQVVFHTADNSFLTEVFFTPAIVPPFSPFPPTVVFVDDDWTGTATGTDIDGVLGGLRGNGQAFGYDQFATIQDAIDAVAVGGIVYVYAGNYVENLQIPKSLDLIGENDLVTGYDPRSAESIIVAPSVSDAMIEVNASDVIIAGFTVDGADMATRAIRVNGVDDVTVQNNIVTAAVRGVQYNGDVAGNTGGLVSQNLIEDLTVGAGVTYGVLAFDASYVSVTDNEIAADAGIFEQYFYQPNGGGNAANVISGNVINAALVGYGTNERAAIAAATALSGNTYNIAAGGVGVQLYNIYKTGGVTLTGETINLAGAGVGVYAFVSGGSVSITGGSIDGTDAAGSKGVHVTNYLTDFGYPATGDGDVTIDGVDISDFAVGVHVEDDSLGAFEVHATITNDTDIFSSGTAILVSGADASVDVTNNDNSISGNAVGIDVDGGSAVVTNNHIFNNGVGVQFRNGGTGSITSNNFDDGTTDPSPDNDTDLLVAATAGVVAIGDGNDFAGDNYYIENLSTQDFDLVPLALTTYEGSLPGNFPDDFRIEDKVFHGPDNGTSGVVTWATKTLFVTTNGTGANNEKIQFAINVADPDDTIYIEAGSYSENLSISKDINLIGVGSVILSPAVSGNTVTINGAGFGDDQTVSIDNIDFNGTAGLAGYGILVDNTASFANLTVTDSSFTGFGFDAIAVFGNAVTGLSVQDVDITDSTFTNNGVAGGGGSGDLQFFEYNGSATLNNLDLSNTGNGAHTGIQFRGVGLQNGTGVLAMGAISLTDVDISGLYVRQMIGLQRYTTAGIGLSDVRLGGAGSAITGTFGAALRIDAVGSGTLAAPTTIDLADTYFRGVTGPGLFKLDVEVAPDGFGFLRADGTDTRWDTSLSTAATPDSVTLPEQFEIEDRILHYVDLTHPNPSFGTFDGFVETVNGKAFITTTQLGNIQRGVNAVDVAGTVHVATGTYAEANILIDKAVTVLGQSRAGTVLTPVVGGQVDDGFIVAASDVTISTLTIDGTFAGDNNFVSAIITPNDGIDRSNLLFTNLDVRDVFGNAIQISWAGDNNEISNNAISQTGGTLEAGRANIAVFGGTVASASATRILDNDLTHISETAIASNFGALLDVRGNSIVGTPLGMNLAALDQASTIGGPLLLDANVIDLTALPSDDVGIQLNFSGDDPFGTTGSILVQGNQFIGSGGDAGIHLFRTGVSPVRILGNTFTSTGSLAATAGEGTAIFVTDDDELFGESTTDNDANVLIAGNTITGFQYGVHVRAVDGEGAAETLSVLIGGPLATDNNEITGSGAAGSKGVFIEDDANASDAAVTLRNNGSSISGFDVGIDLDGGTALVQNNDLNGNTIGVRIKNGGVADLGQTGPGVNYTGLGVSTGANDFSGYVATATSAAGAVVNLNVDAVTGRQGAPPDVKAFNNTWAVNTPAGIENVVYHDSDLGTLGFVDFAAFAFVPGTVLVSDSNIDEGDSVTVSGSFTNVPQAHTVTISWGDGTPNTVIVLPPGTFTFTSAPHVYSDDADGPPMSTVFPIAVSIQDASAMPPIVDGSQSVTVNNVAPTVVLSGPLTSGSGQTQSYSFTTGDPGDDNRNPGELSLVSITATTASGGATGVVSNVAFNPITGSGTFDVTFTTPPGSGTVDVRVEVADDDGASGFDVRTVTVGNTFRVVAFAVNDSGFDVTFNRALDLNGLNLYDAVNPSIIGDVLRLPDLVVQGAFSGVVDGSVVYNPTTFTLTWVKTGAVLASDNYTVTLVSAGDAFEDTLGNDLDGNGDFVAGDDYVQSFVVATLGGTPVVSLPDFARGPGQGVDLTAASNTDVSLPVKATGTNVQGVDFELLYDATLLTIVPATLTSPLPGWTVTANFLPAPPGLTRLKVAAFTGNPINAYSGTANVVNIPATVPTSAAYGASQVLRLQNTLVNELNAQDDAAIQKVYFPGDANGSGILPGSMPPNAYTGADAALIARVVVAFDTGFEATPLIDPEIVGDASGNGTLTAFDASLINQEAAGFNTPEVPDETAPGSGGFAAFDPALSVADDIYVNVGGPVTIPVSVTIEPTIVGITSATFTVSFDTAILDYTSAVLGDDFDSSGWTLAANENSPGVVTIAMFNPQVSGNGGGLPLEIARLTFNVVAATPGFETPLQVAPVDPNEGGLLWTNNPADDGSAIATFSADFDRDGDVDSDDLDRWEAGFGTGTTVEQGDEDRDGDVDGSDFLAWQRQLGSDLTPSVAAASGNGVQSFTVASSGGSLPSYQVADMAAADPSVSNASLLSFQQPSSWWIEPPASALDRVNGSASKRRTLDAAIDAWADKPALVERLDRVAPSASTRMLALPTHGDDESTDEAFDAFEGEFDEAFAAWAEG